MRAARECARRSWQFEVGVRFVGVRRPESTLTRPETVGRAVRGWMVAVIDKGETYTLADWPMCTHVET